MNITFVINKQLMHIYLSIYLRECARGVALIVTRTCDSKIRIQNLHLNICVLLHTYAFGKSTNPFPLLR